MQDLGRSLALLRPLFPFHIQGNARGDVWFGADAIDGLLHLAMTAVSSFHGVRSGRKEVVIQEGQGLLQVGREELLQGFANPLETSYPTPQPGQFLRARFRSGNDDQTDDTPDP